MKRMEGAISDISATPTREAGSCSTTVTSQGKTMFCMPKLENQDATPVRYQGNARPPDGMAPTLTRDAGDA